MTAASPPLVNFGWRAPDFRLADTKGRVWDLDQLRGPKGLLLMFICNHCPYVLAVIDKLVRRARSCATSASASRRSARTTPSPIPRTATRRWAPSPASTICRSPTCTTSTSRVARAYGAACTPDFFGFNAELKLQYRGRLDDSGRDPHPGARRELYEAMRQVADTGQGPREQIPAIGCSIKWKAA